MARLSSFMVKRVNIGKAYDWGSANNAGRLLLYVSQFNLIYLRILI